MKAMILFLIRLCSGTYLLGWAGDKFINGSYALDISDAVYFAAASYPGFHMALGILASVVGVFVILGYVRIVSYLLQLGAMTLNAAIMGLAIATPLFVQPVTAALAVETVKAFTPMIGLFLLALAPIVWWRDDWWALDEMSNRQDNSFEENAEAERTYIHVPHEQQAPYLQAASYTAPAHDAYEQDFQAQEAYAREAYEQDAYEVEAAEVQQPELEEDLLLSEELNEAEQEPQTEPETEAEVRTEVISPVKTEAVATDEDEAGAPDKMVATASSGRDEDKPSRV